MDQQNIDRLFREKLDQLEVAPSSKAWSEVEKQIRRKETPMIYWVAASVSLLLISWFVWPESSSKMESFRPIASEVNHPTPTGTPEFIVPTLEEKASEKTFVKDAPKKKVNRIAQPQLAAKDQEVMEENKSEELPVLELDTKTAVAFEEVENPEINENILESVDKPAFRTVKITYIASSDDGDVKANTPKQDSTGVLKKFIAFAEKIDPGDVLADIKTAKDNLINGGLKNKKDRNSL